MKDIKTSKNNPEKNSLSLLRISINTIFQNEQIIIPFFYLAFFQFLLLEIIYFAPRFPLKIFFGPIISKLWSEQFLHYPLNFVLLPKLFQYTQVPIYIFISSFIISYTISVIMGLNNNQTIQFKKIFKETLSVYVHVCVSAIITFGVVMLLFKLYGLIFQRALEIRSTTGKFFILKNIIIIGSPYFNLLFSILVTTLFAYVIPIIVIDKKKIFSALLHNFKIVFQSPIMTFFVVFIPSMLFVPILLLRNNINIESAVPEFEILTLALTIVVMIIIDIIIYTSLTTFYLLKKESK